MRPRDPTCPSHASPSSSSSVAEAAGQPAGDPLTAESKEGEKDPAVEGQKPVAKVVPEQPAVPAHNHRAPGKPLAPAVQSSIAKAVMQFAARFFS